MDRHRALALAASTSVALGVVIASGCSSDEPGASAPVDAGAPPADSEPPPGPPPLPDDVYGLAGDPLPAGAKLVGAEELARLVASGDAIPVNGRTRKQQEEAAARQEAEDTRTVQPLLAARPHLKGWLTEDPPPDPTLRKLGDGNYLHTISLANGKTGEVVTMGRRWSIHQAAQALRRTESYGGQVELYRRLYTIVPIEWRRSLALVDPIVVEADPKTYDKTAIAAANRRIGAKIPDIVKTFDPDPKPAGYVSDCTLELGAADGSDRSRDEPTCARSPDGLFEKYVWKGKWHLTCVKDQRNRGTCSAFGDTSAIEYWVARTHGRWVNLSEQALYGRARLTWVGGDYGDGLNAYDGLREMSDENWLQPLEKSWPYNPSINRKEDDVKKQYTHSCDNYFDTCSDSTHQSEMVCSKEGDYLKCAYVAWDKNPTHDGYRITGAVELWDPLDPEASFPWLQAFLAAGYPVVIGHAITGAWDDAPKHGGFLLYKANDTQRGGHGIHAVGVIDNETLATVLPSAPAGEGGGYVIIKNSWSRCWGDGGYVYVPWKSIKEWTPDATLLWGVQ